MRKPKRMVTQAVNGHVMLWRSMFWNAWGGLALDEKLTWIVFIGQTIAVITLLEFVFFKR